MKFIYDDDDHPTACEDCGRANERGLCEFCASVRADCALDPYYCVMEGD